MGKGNILIVEDEHIIATYMQVILEQHGYRIAGIVRFGEEAIELATANHPDLILMDIRLKGDMTGIEAGDRIMKTTGIPIIYVTAYAHHKVRDEALQTDPLDFIVKPFNSRYLVGVVERALAKKRIKQTSYWKEGL